MIDSFGPACAAAESVLLDAMVRARSVASDIAVSTRLVLGPAGSTLLREADGAQLLVVGGSRARSGLRGPPADLEGIVGTTTMAEALARRAIEQELARWCDEYADVRVVTKLTPGDPAQALLAESRGAALVVVGSWGQGHVLGTVLGSVSRAVLRPARCPIAIVRRGRGTTAQPPTGVHHGRAS